MRRLLRPVCWLACHRWWRIDAERTVYVCSRCLTVARDIEERR